MQQQSSSNAEFWRAAHTDVCGVRYKTELCALFSKTHRCRYGDACLYAHGEWELRLPEQNFVDGVRVEMIRERARRCSQEEVLLHYPHLKKLFSAEADIAEKRPQPRRPRSVDLTRAAAKAEPVSADETKVTLRNPITRHAAARCALLLAQHRRMRRELPCISSQRRESFTSAFDDSLEGSAHCSSLFNTPNHSSSRSPQRESL